MATSGSRAALALLLALALALAAAASVTPAQQPLLGNAGGQVIVSVASPEDPQPLLLLEEQGAEQAQRNASLGAGRSLLQAAPQRVAWRGRFDPKYQLGYFARYLLYSSRPPAELRQVVIDPITPQTRQPVLRVTYPKGSWSPSGNPAGGTLFYVYPFGANVPIAYQGATLEYDVYFPPDFQFVKGGKLPGLAGGDHGCGGGADPVSCWSVRVMWRAGGAGEAYMYVPEGQQGPDFCTQPPYTKCDYNSGVSLSRGAFYFTPGAWNRVALTVRMNDVGQANGVVEISLNGERKIFYDKVNYRTRPGIQVDSIYFATWYGGSDATWSPTAETYSLFRNIRLYRSDPPGTRLPASITAQAQQTSATLPLHESEPPY